MLKRIIHILLFIGALTGLATPAISQQSQPVLTSFDFTIVGVGIGVSPEYQAVPKGIASQVNTGFFAPGMTLPQDVLDQLPKDFKVTGELTGPAYPAPLTLTTTAGSPFKLPTLPLLGNYTLGNITILDASGKTLFGGTPQAVTIESISDPLITSVTTRPLTLQEIQDRGVVVDSSNFTAYQFTAAIGTESNQQPITFPVIIPNTYAEVNPEQLPPPTDIGVQPPVVNVIPPPELPQNISISGFMMDAGGAELQDEQGQRITLPPIPGIIVIPNNIGFLNQYFSALLLVTNGAPGQSNLVVRDLTATIAFPPGEDTYPGTDEAPGDDPLIMAKGASGFFPRSMAVMNPGPDGKPGTADDAGQLAPAESGQADFTIEGKKEGLHKIDFDITATLEGLPIGPVTIRGKATGAVLVRNPDFSVTLGHPATVRAGEAYDLFVTITNTSKVPANLVTVGLDPLSLSGAALADPLDNGERSMTMIDAGSSATVKYRLRSQRTGKVTATAFAPDPNVTGGFVLRTGVGELNIPLSPDSLIIPYTGSLPEDLVNAAIGLLGQAWSAATAPLGALPADVMPISKQIISSRANDLSEAGLRILMGDQSARAVGDLALDYLGSDSADRAFDDLRRRSSQGQELNRAMAAVFQADVAATGVFDFQSAYARQATSRIGHVSVVTSEAPVRVQITDGAEKKTGGIAAGEVFREIPYSDQFTLSTTEGTEISERSTLSLITKIESPSYRLDLKAEAAAAFDLGIVLPDASGTLMQVRFPGVSLQAGSRAWVTLLPETSTDYVLNIDADGDGTAETITPAAAVIAVPDDGPQIVAVTQLAPGFGPGGDKHGRNVAVLFSERVTKETSENFANYAVDGNAVRIAYLQPSGKMAFLLLRDGIGPADGVNPFPTRSITISGLRDLKNNDMSPASETRPITPQVKGPAAIVTGTVRSAQGETVSNAIVRLLQQTWIDRDWQREARFVIYSEKPVNADGTYQFDYVFQNDDPRGPFMIEAVNLGTGESSALTTNVLYHGQQLAIDLFMKARGGVTGTVFDSAGSPVPGAAVLISTLSDNRTFTTVSDASGAFSFSELRVGAFKLKAASEPLRAEGSTMGTIPDDGGTAAQDVTIFPLAGVKQGNITGTVYESDGQTPRAGAIVIVDAPNYRNWTRTAVDGAYAFTGVFAGNVGVTARDDITGMNASVYGLLDEGAAAVFNIVLKGTGALSGRVTREDGNSSTGFSVLITAGAVQRMAVTGGDGSFQVDGLPTGDISVRVPDPRNSYANLAYGSVTLQAAGDTASILLVIPSVQAATGTVVGTVRKRDGTPWPNAEVRLAIDSVAGIYKPYFADAQGNYVIPDPTNPKDILPIGSYNLIVRSGADIANGTAALWYHGQTAVVDLVPVGMGIVKGTVLDEGSGNIPTGADVKLYSLKPDRLGWLQYDPVQPSATVKSDPQTGQYVVSGVYAGNVTVSATNIFRPTPATKSGVITAHGQTVTLDLLLKDTFGSISGDILLPDGSPAGAEIAVKVRYGGADVVVRTNAAGHFAFEPVIPASTYTILVEDDLHTGRKATASVSVPAGKDVPVSIRLLAKGSLTVNVRNADGTAAVSAGVKANGNSFPNDSAAGPSDANGSVNFSNLSEGAYAVSAVGTSNLGGSAQGTIAADGSSAPVTVTLAASGTVKGTFRKADGAAPITGGQITLKNTSNQVLAYTMTSADPETPGQFTIDFVPLGGFILEGYDPLTDRKGIGGGTIQAGDETVFADVTVTPRGTVKGTVWNNAGTVPVNDARVNINVSGVTNWGFSTVSLPDGSFIIAGVPAGTWTLYAYEAGTGLAGTASGTITLEGEVVATDVLLQPSGTIAGTVRLPDGNPAVKATVSMNGLKKQVDGAGHYQFVNLAANRTYSLTATELGTHRGGMTTAMLPSDGGNIIADITLHGVGSVEGTVYDADGQTVLMGAPVTLQATGIGSVVTAYYPGSSDLNTGKFRFTDVPAGTFTLRATYSGKTTAASASGSLSGEGENVTIDLKLGDVGTVTGTVLIADGVTPAAGGGVQYTGCGRSFIGSIGSSGTFVFNNVPLCSSFTLYMEDNTRTGIGRASGTMTTNGETVNIGTVVLDDKVIAVAGITPAEGAAKVPVKDPVNGTKGYPVTITFSEPPDTGTVNWSNVYVMKGTTRMWWPVAMDAENQSAVIISPSSPLESTTLYTVYVTAGVKDLAGRPLSPAFSSSFTTADTIPATVQFVSPANGAVQVEQNGVVRVTFSEPIDPLSADGIQLFDGSGTVVNVQRDLISSDTIAVLTPLDFGGLRINTTYTISVDGVKDASGNVMPVPFSSFFKTLDTIAPTITALTAPAGADLIVGNTVVVTATASDSDVAGVTFLVDDQVAGAGTKNANSQYTYPVLLNRAGEVTIAAVAQDAAGNTSVATEQSILMITVAADAPPSIKITSPAAVDPGGSLTVTVQASDDRSVREVTLDASGEAVYSGAKANLSGKTYTANFSVPVPASAVIGGEIYLTAAVKDSAGAAAQSNVTVMVRDSIPPTVSLTVPDPMARYTPGGAGTATVTAADSVGVTAIVCTVTGPATGGQTFALDPAQQQASRSFDFQANPGAAQNAPITLSCTARDAAGNPGASEITVFVADIVPPTVKWASMQNNAANVPVNTPISVLFSETLALSSVSTSAVGLIADDATGQVIAGTATLSTDRKIITFAPTAAMVKSAPYKFTINGTITDDAGNALGSDYVLRFTTSTGIDNLQPQVVAFSPLASAVNVPLNARAQVTFSKPINPLTVTGSSFYISSVATGVISVSSDGMTATFTPDKPLLPNRSYTIYVTTAVKDIAGNALYQAKNSSFTTGKTLSDSTAPVVVDVNPMAGATGVPVNAYVVVRFSEPMAATTVNGQTVIVSSGGVALAGELSLDPDGTVVRYKPANLILLAPDTIYEVTVTTGLTDLAGNALPGDSTSFFATGSGTDTTRPQVALVSPVSGSQTVGLLDPVTMTFTEPVNPASINGANIRLTGGGVSGYIPGTLSLSPDRTVVTFVPATPFFAGQWCYLNLSNVEDAAGNKLTGTTSFSFKTVIAPGTDTTSQPTTATVTANPTRLYADGLSTTTIQITGINRSSIPVPNGTKIGIAVSPAYYLNSAGGSIIGGQPANDPRFSVFTTFGGAVTVTYQSPDLPELLPSQMAYAYIQVATLDADNNPMDFIATSTSVLLVRGSAATITTNPTSLRVGAGSSAEILIAVTDAYSKAAAPGTVIGITAEPVYSASSLGGSILGGTVGSDSRYRLFPTTTGGLVTVTYTPPVTIGQNGTAYLQVVSIDGSGQVSGLLGTGSLSLSTSSGYTSPQPQVLTISPAGGSTGVPLNARITATFSQALDPATVTVANFSVTKASVAVAGILSLSPDGKTVTFTPNDPLTPSTTYTIYAGTGLKSVTGSPLLSYASKTFTTGTGTDATALAVSGVTPADGASGVGTNATVTVRFNKQVNAAGVDTGTLTVSSGGVNIAGKVSVSPDSSDNTAFTFTPDRFLDPQTTYTVGVSAAVTDVAGNALTTAFTSTFTTSTGMDNFQPQVVSISPVSGSLNVAQNTVITVTFSEPVAPMLLSSANLRVSGPGGTVSGTITIGSGNTTATFTPAYPLFAGGYYTVSIANGVQDMTGNPLLSSVSSGFTIGAASTSNTQPTSASVTVNPTSIFADGTISTTIIVNDIKKNGVVVPNGTIVAVTASPAFTANTVGGTVSGSIVGSSPDARFVLFATFGASIQFSYTPPDLRGMRPGLTSYGVIQIASIDGNENPVSLINSGTATLYAIDSGTIIAVPSTFSAAQQGTSAITVSVKDRNGNAVPDGTMVGLTCAPIYATSTMGGTITGGVTSSADSRVQIFITSSGQFTATYATPTMPHGAGNETLQAVTVDAGGQVTGLIATKTIIITQ